MFLDETERIPESFQSFWFRRLIAAPILSLSSRISEVPALVFFLYPGASLRMPWVSVSIHIVRHLTTSGDWSNSYHPTQLSGRSFSPCCGFVAPHLRLHAGCFFFWKGRLKTVQTSKRCYFMCSPSQSNVTIWEMNDARKNNNLENCSLWYD